MTNDQEKGQLSSIQHCMCIKNFTEFLECYLKEDSRELL